MPHKIKGSGRNTRRLEYSLYVPKASSRAAQDRLEENVRTVSGYRMGTLCERLELRIRPVHKNGGRSLEVETGYPGVWP